MNNKFFLYLDILGFTELVRNDRARIDDLYEVIASLNANNHHAFKVVVFSDTVVVYNVDGGDTPADAKYLVMFMCEFVRDLMHRLMGREIYFRAVITHGDFTHYELNGIPCFFGNALVDAYNSEKQLKAIGLFIDKKVSQYCDIFNYKQYNENFDFVYVTQSLDEIEIWGGSGFPIPSDMIECTDSKWFLAPELDHVLSMLKGAYDNHFPDSVRLKYKASWDMYCKHYPNITSELAKSRSITSISPNVGWKEVFDRHPEDCSYAIEVRKEF
ncbi:hypothetical protein [Vibrio coralliilyticus]|uniref:hypothetical protein n=1 Tax=Vibrio coralliilyticus TaxID=190893 RepID=UPI00155F7669|nr:hypothetical protein [Vibrio coralliilyticus]NRF65316.1 hypothetical protein [Vibrio coralliilyticus]